MRGIVAALAGLCLSLGMAAPRAQDIGTDVAKAFKEGTFNVSFRYRYEFVDDDNPALTHHANASTLRSRLTYKTAEYQGLSGLIEVDDLRSIGVADFNSTRNGKTTYATVADPQATDLNQMALRYTGLNHGEIIVGRQRILRGNERFIGPVGWRQNEQTMDSASINYKFSDKLQAYYAFVSQVNRINGPNTGTPPADLTGQTHLADVTYAFGPRARLTAYGYFLDLEESPALSSQSIGLRLAGDIPLSSDWSIPYAVEYATQDDYADNPNDYSADYYTAEAGARWKKFSVKLAYEVLEGDTVSGHAFQTPLATAHAFQGWADKFLTTPDRGIEDAYVLVEAGVLGGTLRVRYDDYHTETGSPDHYGNELGIWQTWPIAKSYAVAVKYAAFDADSTPPPGGPYDTDKFWVMLSANF